MSIGRKLLLAFLVSTVSVAAVGVTGLVNISQVREQGTLLYTRNTHAMESLISMTQDYLKMQSLVRDLILDRNAARIDDYQSKLDDLDKALANDLTAYKEGLGRSQTDASKALAGFDQTYQAYRQILVQLFSLVRKGDTAAAVSLLQDEGALKARDLTYLVDGLVGSNEQDASERFDASGRLSDQAFATTVVMLVLAALLSLLSAFWLSNNLAHPLVGTAGLARRLAESDLTAKGSGENSQQEGRSRHPWRIPLKRWRRVLSGFVATLKETGGELARSAHDLDGRAATAATAAGRIAQAAQSGHALAFDQAGRVEGTNLAVERIVNRVESFDRLIEDQVASVAQTTSSIEEMTSNIRTLSDQAGNLGRAFGGLRTSSDDGRGKSSSP